MTLECVQLTIKAEQDRHTQCTLHRAFSEPSSGLSGQVRTAQHDYPHPVTVPVLCFSSKGTWMVPRRRCHPWRSQQKPCPGSPKIPCYLSGELWLVVAGSCLAVVARHVELPYPGGLGVGVGGVRLCGARPGRVCNVFGPCPSFSPVSPVITPQPPALA